MSSRVIEECPRCRKPLDAGFAHRNLGLSFISPEKLDRFVSVDEDVAKAGLLPRVLPWKAAYLRSYLCRGCELYMVDYGKTLSRTEAKKLAKSLERRR